MKDKIVLVTGSTDGIGKQTALDLAKMGATVLVHARNLARGKSCVDSLLKSVPEGKFDLVVADFGSFNQVRKMADEISKKYSALDVLINNAAIYNDKRMLSADDIEMTFQVNHLAPFLLTNLLLNNVKASERGRIVNVSSMVHQSARFSFKNLQGEEYYDGYNAYSCSKLENLVFTMRLTSMLEKDKVTVNALHPGVINTKLLHAAMGSGRMGSPAKDGAATSVYLASSPEVERVAGKYFVNCKERAPSPVVFDHNLQTKLWEVSEAFTELS